MDYKLRGIINKEKKDGVYTAWASTVSIDRDDEIVLPAGLMNREKYLSSNPVMFYDHAWTGGMFGGKPTETSLPIAKALDLFVDKSRGVMISFEFASHPFAQTVKSLVDEKILNTLSIGFMAHDAVNDIEQIASVLAENGIALINKSPRNVITKWEMLETSIVGIPSNRDAEIIRNSAPEKAATIKSILCELRKVESTQKVGDDPKKAEEYDRLMRAIRLSL